MKLSRKNLAAVVNANIPSPEYFDLPERVLQFGTGVLLRGLPDYFIDQANKQGVFKGRIVVVKSTGGEVSDFDSQNGLYTHCIYGIRDGVSVASNIVNASISRVLSAVNHWNDILKCAADPQMQIVISNTTEVGITLVKESIHASPPASFPGKLLAFLFERYTVFQGAADKGLVVVPTELITENGTKLKTILIQLAHENGLDEQFTDWLSNSNYFCNSLVDRIVPGKLSASQKESVETELGVEDDLMIISEPYCLWAIESGNSHVKEMLSFYKTDEGVVIVPDITIYRELKLRLLNGTHTFSCGLAFLAGFDTVKEMMEDNDFVSFMTGLMAGEITPSITGDMLGAEAASSFASAVLDRFRNPYIEHKWLNITLQYSSKMAMRNVPVIIQYMQRTGEVPLNMALGFAAHILFLKCTLESDGKYYGRRNGNPYPVSDDNAAFYASCWQHQDIKKIVSLVLANQEIWGADLLLQEGFADEVTNCLAALVNDGALAVVRQLGYNNKM